MSRTNINSAIASESVSHTFDQRLDECRRLVEAGTHPQILSMLRDTSSGHMQEGAGMELFITQKKSTSTLDLHGVRVNVVDPNTAVETRKKHFFICFRCYEASVIMFGHSSKPPVRIDENSTNYTCKHL